MSIAVDNRCVLLNDAWDSVQIYIVIDVQPDFVLLRSSNDHFQTEPVRRIEKLEMDQLFVTPLWTEGNKNDPKNYAIATLVDADRKLTRWSIFDRRQQNQVPIRCRVLSDQRSARLESGLLRRLAKNRRISLLRGP